jgi:hypothetical protein
VRIDLGRNPDELTLALEKRDPLAQVAGGRHGERLDGRPVVGVVAGKVCTKQCGRLDRCQGRCALVPGEAGAMRRVQAPSRGGANHRSTIYQ